MTPLTAPPHGDRRRHKPAMVAALAVATLAVAAGATALGAATAKAHIEQEVGHRG